MHYSVALFLYGAQLIVATATSMMICNQDKCLRAVEGSAFTTRHGTADCSSFFKVTVTPATTTATATIVATTVTATTVTITTTVGAPAKRRDANPAIPRTILGGEPSTTSPTSVPAYASACSGTARYSSACSCIGVTHHTVTAATPTTTATIFGTSTVTATTVVTAGGLTACGNALPTFVVKVEGSNIVYNNIPLDGTYDEIDTGDGVILGFNGSPRSDAAALSLNAAGNLVINSYAYIGYQDPGQSFELIHFDTPASVATNELAVVCDISTGYLKCANGENTILQLCPGVAVTDDLFLGAYVGAGCTAINLQVVPLCTTPL